MAGYTNTESTLGFWKFNKANQWNYNSIIDSVHIFNFQKNLTDEAKTARPNYNCGIPELSKNYSKSRKTSIYLPETSCIYSDLPLSLNDSTFNLTSNQVPSALTIEFWVYIEKGTNTNDPSNFITVYPPSKFKPTSYTSSMYKPLPYYYSNPFLFTYGLNKTSMSWMDDVAMVYNGGWTRYIKIPTTISLSYCCYNNAFSLTTYNTTVQFNLSDTNVGMANYKFENCPPNKWYHIALVLENMDVTSSYTGGNKIYWFINGKKYTTGGSKELYIGGYWTDAGRLTSATVRNIARFTTNNKYISFGNRLTPTGSFAYDYALKDSEGLNYTNEAMNPGFQNVYIDDIRITKGVLYTTDFTPPGMIGKQILIYDDYAYYVDPTSEDLIKLSFSKWSDISESDKIILLERVAEDYLPEIDQIKILQTDPSKPIQIENYQTDTITPKIIIEKINPSANQIVYPTNFFDYEAMQDYLVNITASGTITSSSMVRLAVTRDGKDYYTYNLSNSEWVPLDNKEDVLNNGIKLTDLKDIPKSSWIQFGLSKFAFSIGLYRNTDTSTCQIEDIILHLSLDNKWIKANTTTQSKYKYIGPTLLRVTFLEEGKYKINYNDRGGE